MHPRAPRAVSTAARAPAQPRVLAVVLIGTRAPRQAGEICERFLFDHECSLRMSAPPPVLIGHAASLTPY